MGAVVKRAKVLTAYGEDSYTIRAEQHDDYALIMEIVQGGQIRLEIYPKQFKQHATSLMNRELARYDLLGIGATGRVVELESVNPWK